MLSRTTMFVAWYELFRRKFGSKREFVSLDALDKRYSTDPRSFELRKVNSAGGQPPATPPNHATEKFTPKGDMGHSPPPPGYYSPPESERVYRKPTMSFSGPQAPPRSESRNDWHATDTYATGGGGLASHPPPRSPDRPPRPDQYDPKAGRF
jgi:hypothetical protein